MFTLWQKLSTKVWWKVKWNVFKYMQIFYHYNNKFILLLRKGVYPYEYMDHCEKFNETMLPEKEDFYHHLNMEDNTNAGYAHAKRVCKDIEMKN